MSPRPSFALALLALLAAPALGVNLTGSMYTYAPHSACYRSMHSRGGVGCWGPKGGTVGALVRLDTAAGLNSFVAAAAGATSKSALLLAPALFTAAHMQLLNSTAKVAGVLVEHSATTAVPFSPGMPDGSSVPALLPTSDGTAAAVAAAGAAGGAAAAAAATRDWDSHGSGMSYALYRFPVVLLENANETQRLQGLIRDASVGGDTQVKFDLFFGPSTATSLDCLKIGACDPTGGQSVWSAYGDLAGIGGEGTEGTEGTGAGAAGGAGAAVAGAKPGVVMLATAMDSFAFFPEKAVGANAGASGVITALAAADALARAPGVATLPHRIVVAAFQGESRGRVGSRKFVQDLASFKCNSFIPAANATTKTAMCLHPFGTCEALKR